jgi:hypothetical protein
MVPPYMDIHRIVKGLTAEADADAHQKDLEAQDEHEVQCLNYWYGKARAQSSACSRPRAKKRQMPCIGMPTALPRRDHRGQGRLIARNWSLLVPALAGTSSNRTSCGLGFPRRANHEK